MNQSAPAHLLIVDDDFEVRKLFGTVLHRQHYRVSSAASGAEAFALIAEDQPDLIILDHFLPDTSGEAILGRLRADPRTHETPVIFLTIDDSMPRFRSVMELGADDFLTKPAAPRDLSDAVAAQLTKSRQRTRRREAALTACQPSRQPGVTLHGAAANPIAGAAPPGYTILSTLGRGGTATAYLARHHERAGQCVLKIISKAGMADPEVAGRFALEGAVLSRINHPNVVRVYEQGEIGGHAWLAMELVDGGTLKQMLGQPWERYEALRLMLKLGRALQAVHGAGVIHRDLKPDNILLRADSLEPVLLDFGAAFDLRSTLQLTQAGNVLGTPSYMAPEVIAGLPAQAASDIYACGVMFYELLTGERPFEAPDITELMRQHMGCPVPRLPERHGAFQPLLDRLLAKNPHDRPRDGARMASDITALWCALTGDMPVLAPAAHLSYAG
jgi:CheY-like chemotaxis protein